MTVVKMTFQLLSFYFRQTTVDAKKASKDEGGSGVELDLADPVTNNHILDNRLIANSCFISS